MTKKLILICFSFFLLLLYIYACDTDPEIKRDGIKLSWPVCEFSIGKETFYSRSCRDHKVEGVTVCVEDRPDIECSETDTNGEFELKGVPKNSEVFLSMKKDQFIPLLVHVKTGQSDIELKGINMAEYSKELDIGVTLLVPPVFKWFDGGGPKTDAGCDLAYEASIAPEADYGEIAAIALEFGFSREEYPKEGDDISPVKGTKVSILSEKNGSIRYPIYTDKTGVPCYRDGKGDGKSHGGIDEGYALFTDLVPGYYRVTFDVPDHYFCIVASIMTDRMFWGFRTEIRNQTWVRVKAGHNSPTAIKCYPIGDAGVESEDSGSDAPSGEQDNDASTDAGSDSQIDNG